MATTMIVICFLHYLTYAAAVDVRSSANYSAQAAPLAPVITLDPIHASDVHHIENRSTQTRATARDYTTMAISDTMALVSKEYGLRDNESFYWGINGNPVAHLTAFAEGKDVRVLSLERFDRVLETSECSSDTVTLRFTKEVEFDQIQDAWQWINSADERYLVLVTQNAQCNVVDGDPTIRQPWHVTRADFDDNDNVVTLSATPKTWKEAFPDWRMKVSSRGIQINQQHHSRDVNSNRLESSPSINLNHNISGGNFGITAHGATALLNCTLCETHGTLDLDIDITPYCDGLLCINGIGLKGNMSVTADKVGTTFQVKTTISGSTKGFERSFDFPSWSPVGFHIPGGVLDIGPELKFGLDAKLGKVEAKASLEAGVKLELPSNAMYSVDLQSHKKSKSTWNPSFTPSMDPDIDGSVSLIGSIGGHLKLDLSASVLGVGSEIGLELAAPRLDMSAKAFQDEDACDVHGAAAGVSLDVGVGMTLQAYEVASVQAIDVGATQPIWSMTKPLYTTCLTIDAVEATSTLTQVAPLPMGNNRSESQRASGTTAVAADQLPTVTTHMPGPVSFATVIVPCTA